LAICGCGVDFKSELRQNRSRQPANRNC